MSDLISRKALLEQMQRKHWDRHSPCTERAREGYNNAIMRVRSMISKAPSVEDVVHVGRCSACCYSKEVQGFLGSTQLYCRYFNHDVDPEDFCSMNNPDLV